MNQDEDQEQHDSSRFDNSPEIIKDFYACYFNKLQPQTKKK